MKIGIIDADLLGRQKHRFPNLVCEKLSAYWKEQGAEVELKLDYNNLDEYDHVYISKVFTDTWVPEWIQAGVNMDTGKTNLPDNIHVGGTGFFFAHASDLDYEIEHHMPDYDLYSEWIKNEIEKAKEASENAGKKFDKSSFMVQFKEYTDYSIGFMTRGCFRKCPFCVNQKYDRVLRHSALDEFYDPSRKKICLLDDNFLGCPEWKNILQELIALKKPFKFKQGIDERLLTDESDRAAFIRKYMVLLKLYPRIKKTFQFIEDKEAAGDLPPVIDRNQIKLVLANLDAPCPLCANPHIGETGRQHLENLLTQISVSSKTSNYLKEIKSSLEYYLEEVQKYQSKKMIYYKKNVTWRTE